MARQENSRRSFASLGAGSPLLRVGCFGAGPRVHVTSAPENPRFGGTTGGTFAAGAAAFEALRGKGAEVSKTEPGP